MMNWKVTVVTISKIGMPEVAREQCCLVVLIVDTWDEAAAALTPAAAASFYLFNGSGPRPANSWQAARHWSGKPRSLVGIV